MADAKRFVGIDGANAQLDVAIGPNGESLSVRAGPWRDHPRYNGCDLSPLTW